MEKSGSSSRSKIQEQAAHPPSFCKIPVPILHRYVHSGVPPPHEFKTLADCTPLQVSVSGGEMLYLPAGWFHEVSSFGEEASRDGENEGDGKEDSALRPPVHVALNYWMYPPAQRDFQTPYVDKYWESVSSERGVWGSATCQDEK
mmetsp:Transcript_30213/g.49251  ORF Transcript_30213/g.49251 Transcript_30213/m.49251 type:complete len:145 (-) Transcript_30213:219-653(-)